MLLPRPKPEPLDLSKMDLSAAARALGLHKLIVKVPYLGVQLDDGVLSILAHNEPTGISVLHRDEQWVVETDEWHGHFESAADALTAAKLLLCGQARTVVAKRGERLAATWRETWDGEAFETSNVAYYLSPFDRQEWELWPGEQWVIERKARLAIGVADWKSLGLRIRGRWLKPDEMSDGVIEGDSFAMKPDDWMLNRFSTSLGSPPEGCRWASNTSATFVFPLPLEFRSSETERQSGPKLEVFLNQSETRCFRVQVGYREVEASKRERTRKENSGPTLVEQFDDESTRSEGWFGAMWRVYFNDDQDEMLAQVGAYQRSDADLDFIAFRSEIEQLLHKSAAH
ncbi:MAG: hypothetical protein HZC36_16615 [Armatimonadetes bacterium]|nr:hypothetical protein [Armatimonadota bacterium]